MKRLLIVFCLACLIPLPLIAEEDLAVEDPYSKGATPPKEKQRETVAPRPGFEITVESDEIKFEPVEKPKQVEEEIIEEPVEEPAAPEPPEAVEEPDEADVEDAGKQLTFPKDGDLPGDVAPGDPFSGGKKPLPENPENP